MAHHEIDESRFAGEDQLLAWLEAVAGRGYRGTGMPAHEAVIAWVEDQLAAIEGVSVRTDMFDILGWTPKPDLAGAGSLSVDGADVAVAGAVPYSSPSDASGAVVHLPRDEPITAANAAGRVVVREFPKFPLPYDILFSLGSYTSAGCESLRGEVWDRPGLADGPLHLDLLAAGEAGAAAVVFALDLPREQIAGYFEPHKGTHYAVPGVFVGAQERDRLVAGAAATVAVRAAVEPVTTRNVIATLPGRSDERIVLVTHTDGNTWVQENGIAALLGLLRYLAALDLGDRPRTIEVAFTSAHLHISREGSARYFAALDPAYDEGTVAFAFAVEHLGSRELVPVDGALTFTGGSEVLLWCVGPSESIRHAVIDAVERRGLDRVLVLPGFGAPDPLQVPRVLSFGGLGTHPNMHLIPTTSIITGPWSLWAPVFGPDAIDIADYRRQALAAGDVVMALGSVPRDELAGEYSAMRAKRAAGARWVIDDEPPERATT